MRSVLRSVFPRGLRAVAVLVAGLAVVAGPTLAVGSSAASTVSFREPAAYPAGDRPYSVVTGDFNGDSAQDLAGDSRFGVTVLLGKGDGTFQSPVTYPAGDTPVFVGAAMVDGDRHLDLVAVDRPERGRGAVSVLAGRGDGSFAPPATYEAGVEPTAVVAVDLNGDSRTDLAVASEGGAAAIMLQRPGGGFAAPVFYPTGDRSFSIVAGSFDRDKTVDLAVANGGSNTVSVLLGRGDGTFAPAINYGTGGGFPQAVLAARLDGDDATDLAIANTFTSNVAILRGNGDGSFMAPVTYSTLPDGNGPVSLATGDFDGDGTPDLVSANTNSDNVTVLLGKGDGSFATRVHFKSSPATSNPKGVAVARLNGDPLLDLVVTNHLADSVSVLLNTTVSKAPGPSPSPTGSPRTAAS